MKTVQAILTADWHLREDVPVCRTDDFWETQWGKVEFISALQERYQCSVFHAGDLFDHWKPSPRLLSETIYHLPKNFYTVYGNHDLPQHNWELRQKSGIYTLEAAKCLTVLEGTHWTQEPIGLCRGLTEKDPVEFLVWHVYNYQGKKPWPGCLSPRAGKLLRQYPQYKLILTGDNHKTFVEEYNGNILVNPGSIFRMSADQVDHKPCVFLWYTDNSIEQVFLPIKKVISQEHLEATKERIDRIEAFIKSLNTDFEIGASFEENLQKFIQINKIHLTVVEIINKVLPKNTML